MGSLKKEVAAKPHFPAQPNERASKMTAEDLFARTMKRYPKTMKRLGE